MEKITLDTKILAFHSASGLYHAGSFVVSNFAYLG